MASTPGADTRDPARAAEHAGEPELGDGLGQTGAPREISYLSVAAGVAVVGTLAVLLLTRVSASHGRVAPLEERDPPAAELRRARELYESGAFAEARIAFDELARRAPSRRVHDYRARLARVDGDAALIARARGRLALGDAAAALALSRDVASNSPLHGEAWSLGREAQAELERAARQRAQAEREARALQEASALAAAQEEAQAEVRRHKHARKARKRARANTPY